MTLIWKYTEMNIKAHSINSKKQLLRYMISPMLERQTHEKIGGGVSHMNDYPTETQEFL